MNDAEKLSIGGAAITIGGQSTSIKQSNRGCQRLMVLLQVKYDEQQIAKSDYAKTPLKYLGSKDLPESALWGNSTRRRQGEKIRPRPNREQIGFGLFSRG